MQALMVTKAMRRSIRFIFRGVPREVAEFDPATTLLEWLREEERAVGTKEGCNEGDCGACTVVLARLENDFIQHDPVNACILLLGQIDGAEVLTVEDLAVGGSLHRVQAAMLQHHGSQCGFCTPGIVMSLFAAYHSAPRPVSRAAIEECLAGNLCRCTGYRPIVDAALDALALEPDDAFTARLAERVAALEALRDERDIVTGHEDRFLAAPYHLDSLLTLTATHPEAVLVAGGTDTGLWVTKKFADFGKVITLNRVAGLDEIVEGDDALFLGATITLARATPALERIDSDLGVLMRRFGSKQVRASGTIGGNIANGSPIGDLAPALIALGSVLHLRLGEARRDLNLEDFFLAYGKQDRAPGEIVAGLTIPRLSEGRHLRCFKISKRFDEDISALMGAFCVTLDEQKITGARIAFGGMAATPRRALHCEAALVGASIDSPSEWGGAVMGLGQDFEPISDMRASARYRSRVARALLGKALIEVAGARTTTRITPRPAPVEPAEVHDEG